MTRALFFNQAIATAVVDGLPAQGLVSDSDSIRVVPSADGSSVAKTLSGGVTTFSNDVTCTTAEWESGDGMGILLNALASIPWFDGKLKDGSMAKPMIVTSNMLRAAKARQVLGMITTTLGSPLIGTAAGGSQQSPWSGMASSVENFQDLYDPTNFADSGKYVYAFATTGGATQPAFIVSPKRWPEFHVYGLDPNEEIRRVWRAIGWDWDAFYGVGPGLPQCGARIKIG